MTCAHYFPLLLVCFMFMNSNAFQLQASDGLSLVRPSRSVSSCTRTYVSDIHNKEFKVAHAVFYVKPSQTFKSLKFRIVVKRLHINKHTGDEVVEFTKEDVVTSDWNRVSVTYVKKTVPMASDEHTLEISVGDLTKATVAGYNRHFNGFEGFKLEASGGMEILYDCRPVDLVSRETQPEDVDPRDPRLLAPVKEREAVDGKYSNWKLGLTLGVVGVLVLIVVGVAGTVALRAYRNLEQIDAAVSRRQSQVSRSCSQASRTGLPAPLVLRNMTDGEQRRLSDNIYEELDETAFQNSRQNMGSPQSGGGCSIENTSTREGSCSRGSTASREDICSKENSVTLKNHCEPLFLRTPRKFSMEISAHTGRRNNHYVDVTSFLHMKNHIGEC